MSISIAKIKYVQSLRVKKFRQKFNHFIVEGDKAVRELINSDWEIEEIFLTENFEWPENSSDLNISNVNQQEMERLSGHQSPQNSLAVVKQKEFLPDNKKLKSGFTLIIDGIQDPGNLGTLVRIADWYGIDQVICSPDSVDLYNHKTIAASMGSFLRIPVSYVNLLEIMNNEKAVSYACVMDGKNLHHVQSVLPAVIIIGNEGSGIKKEIVELADHKISIPKFGAAESLNASVAAAVVLDRFRAVQK